MDSVKREIALLALDKFPDASGIEINPDYSSSHSKDSIPGRFFVNISFESVGIRQQAARQWSADQGFHFVLEAPSPDFMSAAGREPWDRVRTAMEQSRIDEGSSGVESVVLELTSDVKKEGQPTNYRVNVQIGRNQSNRLSLQVDSGSSVLWAQSRVQRNQPIPPNRSVLDLTIADAARFQKGSEVYEIVYGSKKKVKFSLFEGLLSVGSLRTNQVFGAAEIVKDETSLPTGIIGLGFAKQDSPIPFHRTLVVQLKESGMIRRASFALIGPRAEPAGTVRPNDRREKDRGWLVIGRLEDRYHNGITWCPALVEKHRSWVVRLNKVLVNGTVICENQLALVDTGTSYLVTSKTHIDSIAKAIQGKVTKARGLTYTSGALEDVSFVFGDGDNESPFALNDEDLSLGPASDTNTEEVKSPFIYLPDSDHDEMKDFWILGGIFIDNMVTVFDYTGDMRIGFASKSAVDPTISDVAKL